MVKSFFSKTLIFISLLSILLASNTQFSSIKEPSLIGSKILLDEEENSHSESEDFEDQELKFGLNNNNLYFKKDLKKIHKELTALSSNNFSNSVPTSPPNC